MDSGSEHPTPFIPTVAAYLVKIRMQGPICKDLTAFVLGGTLVSPLT